MAEVWRDEGEGRCKDLDLSNNRRPTGLDRTKSDRFHSSRGPFSSIRAAIRRTRTNSQSDRTRERRRSEIIVISSEPLDRRSDASEISTSEGIRPPPSYDQVIKEKTQEVHPIKPTAAPRRSSCSDTSTKNDSVKDDATKKSSPAKKPQKPPRPSLPKSLQRRNTFAAGGSAVRTITPIPIAGDRRSTGAQVLKEPSFPLTRSVTVHWDSGGKRSDTSYQSPVIPVPLPRIKSKRQTDTEAPPLVVVSCDSQANAAPDPRKVHTNEYLKELLDVFSAQESRRVEETSDQDSQGDDADGDMSTRNGQSNMQARIQAFESQPGSEERYVAGPVKPQPLPRKGKPPVAAKPSAASKPPSEPGPNHSDQNVLASNETPDARPLPPKKPVGHPVKEELETLLNKGPGLQRARPLRLTRVDSIHDEEPSAGPPTPPVKPKKEPLKPNLNINNHNSAAVAVQNVHQDVPAVPAKPQTVVDCNGTSTRQGPTRRPTMIRVPSKTAPASEQVQDTPPPLPAQKPVGSLRTSVIHKQSSTPILPSQESFGMGPEPTLPPRRATMNKTLPPRPAPAKPGPGRPPQPSLQASGRAHSVPWDVSPRPSRTGQALPPRPHPGHRLYNKYTLQLPHGIASADCQGLGAGELSFQKNEVLLLLEEMDDGTFECQVGAATGRVHKSQMKVITPLEPTMSSSPGNGLAGGDGSGMKVQAIYDFTAEGPGELGLRSGDIVSMVEAVDNQWYRGSCRGVTGFFPISHVKVLVSSESIPERNPQPPSARVSGPRCVARFDFEGERSDELSFSEGDVIQLAAYVGQDWARGQVGNRTGIFPLNFVEIVEDLPPVQSQPSRIPLPGLVSTPSVQPEVHSPAQTSEAGAEWVVALYDFAGESDNDLSFQQGDRILITKHVTAEWSLGRLNGREGLFPLAFVEAAHLNEPSNFQASGGRGKALYTYASNCEEELSLQAGDILTNLESVDDEWFLADLNGNRALVPKNYVQVLG
ncbi:SH3 domain-containing protein 19 [Neosynchiropus ocellatus]